jgi:Skp family chaperone for outer membrane proteins
MSKFEDFVLTGEFIERELTADEKKQLKKDQDALTAIDDARKAEAAAKAEAKTALLDRLGITAEEAKLLLA